MRQTIPIHPENSREIEQINEILRAYKLGEFSTMAGKVIACRDGSEIVGCAAIAPEWTQGVTRWWLNGVAVRRDRRRQGIGKELIATFTERCPPRDQIWLETLFWNRRFYTSCGFTFQPIRAITDQLGFDPRHYRNTMVMFRQSSE